MSEKRFFLALVGIISLACSGVLFGLAFADFSAGTLSAGLCVWIVVVVFTTAGAGVACVSAAIASE